MEGTRQDRRGDERAEKQRLRRELRGRLAAIPVLEAEKAAAKLAPRALQLPEIEQARRVFLCLSFGVEIDTWGLVEALLGGDKQVFVPRTEKGDPRIHVHPYPCPLRKLSFGLRQPSREAPEIPHEKIDESLDVALILGLGFDLRGYRLGYGAGYFDRFLRNRPFPAVGLAYDLQLLEQLPAEPHDVPMGILLTEKRILRPE